MKKWPGVMLGVLLVGALNGWAVPTTNLLLNPSFDNPTNASDWTSTYWTAGGITPLRETWAARLGYRGGAMPTWSAANSSGYVLQSVNVTGATVYTFTIWQRAEPSTAQTYARLKMEWLDGADAVIQAESVNVYTNTAGLPIDDQWHQLALTAACTSQNLAKIRVTYEAGWSTAGSAIFFDDAQLYPGVRQSERLGNNSFEVPLVWDDEGWRHSLWMSTTDGGGSDVTAVSWEGWAARSGNWGIAFRGWQYASNRYQATIWQNLYPMTGTCTFALWLQSDPNAHISNFIMKVEWFDDTFTNKVQTDSQTNIAAAVVLDNVWHEYYLTTATTSPAAKEARLSIWADWTPADNATHKMDDARFFSGPYTNSVVLDWGYHSGGTQDPALEFVPGTNVGTFLQVNYATTTTTFYALANYPSVTRIPEETGEVWMRLSWERPPSTGIWVDHFTNMTLVGTVDLTAGSPFHGSPAAGTNTVALWRCDWPQPATNGVPYTNAVTVYYAPFFKSTYGPLTQSDRRYMVDRNGQYTNNYASEPQIFADSPMDKDYAYVNFKPTPIAALTNGGFENPVGVSGLAGSGWYYAGGQIGRERYWPAHTGEYGGYFSSWNSGYGQIWQDITVTSPATRTFSLWVYQETAFNPSETLLKLEWYNTDYQLVQVDERDLTTVLPRDGGWHQVYLTGVCTNNNLFFVRPIFISTFNGGSGSRGVFYDDVQFYDGPFTGSETLGNGSFESGFNAGGQAWAGLRGSQWWTAPIEQDDEAQGACRRDWAYRSGSYGFAYMSFTNGNLPILTNYYTVLSQCLTPGTGTYTFSFYALKEDASAVTNMVMGMTAYDRNFNQLYTTNRNVTADLANYWKRMDITGVANDTNTYEVRVWIQTHWLTTTNEGLKACKVDDARFVRGAYGSILANMGYGYHNNTSLNARAEAVPGSAVGPFLQVDYARTATTFYVLSATNVALRSDEAGVVGIRIYYQNPLTLEHVETWNNMNLIGTVSLGSPFHGISGQTLNLWKYEWSQPLDSGAPITNAFTVYYAPYLRSYYGVILTDTKFYAGVGGAYTNGYLTNPQEFADWYAGTDYLYVNAFTNSGSTITDGIPNEWWARYGITERIATNNPDADPADNFREYVADTDPTNGLSYFPNATFTVVSGGVVRLYVNPSSTGRIYDVQSRTNLIVPDWVTVGVSNYGNGGQLTLTVTNTYWPGYYRTSVRVP